MPWVTAIVLVLAPGDAIEPEEVVPDEELQDLQARLTTRWRTATVGREPPAIWGWEPLVESGHIAMAGLVAIAELDVSGGDEERQALKREIADWLASSSARGSARVSIVWATQMITYTIETLPCGVAESRERYGCPHQGTVAVHQRPQTA